MGTSGCLEETPTNDIIIQDIIIPNTHNIKTSNSIYRKTLTHKEDPRIKIFRFKIVGLHNTLRKKHDAPELIEDPKLNDIADEYAINLLKNQGQIEEIYKERFFGENAIITGNNNATQIFKKWEDERERYDFKKSKFTKDTSHFTQIVWKETKQIGIGFCFDKENNNYSLVFLYDPPGNTLGNFSKNVTK